MSLWTEVPELGISLQSRRHGHVSRPYHGTISCADCKICPDEEGASDVGTVTFAVLKMARSVVPTDSVSDTICCARLKNFDPRAYERSPIL
jgi:hypothetical protein